MNEQPPTPDAKPDVVYENVLHENLNWHELKGVINHALLVDSVEC